MVLSARDSAFKNLLISLPIVPRSWNDPPRGSYHSNQPFFIPGFREMISFGLGKDLEPRPWKQTPLAGTQLPLYGEVKGYCSK